MSLVFRRHRRAVVLLVAGALSMLGLVPATPASAAPSGYSVEGIDVSVYQGTIAWNKVAAAGVDFAYARASLGSGYTDPTFAANNDGAKANGLYFGAYHFARPDQSGGRAQADWFLDRARFANDGKTLPPMLDIEWATGVPTCFNLTQAQMASWVGAFVGRVKERTGRVAMIYTNTYWWNQCVGTAANFGNHPLAYPCYCSSPGLLPNGWSRFSWWQWTDSGQVSGVTGNVDRDVFNGTMADLKALAKGNGRSPLRDFDADGDSDVLARHGDTKDLWLYKGDGRGAFQYGDQKNVWANWSMFDIIVAPGDFDGDGDADVIARHKDTKALWLYKGDGRGSFQFGDQVEIWQNWSMFDVIIAPGDFDGDGDPDLLARHGDTKDLWLYKGDGRGSFQFGDQVMVWANWSAFDMIVAPGDFDRDGDVDVIARHRDTKDLWLYKGDGRGSFQFGDQAVVWPNWGAFDSIIGVNDFDGDGDADLLARHGDTKDLWLYKGDGRGSFQFGDQAVVWPNWGMFDRII